MAGFSSTGVSWEVSVHLYGFPHAAGPELDRLAAGPAGSAMLDMEAALALGALLTEARVHVITGYLKGSGTTRSSAGHDGWEGEIDYSRYPGIYELARGDRPTKNHPRGRHNFFGAYDNGGGPQFERGVRQAVWDYVTDGAGPAPAGGLEPRSGG